MANVIRLKAPGGADQLESVTIELPPPQPDEVQIRQTAIGVNLVDIYQRMGLYPMSPAAIPGIEAVGLVTDVGANVTSLRAGDRIAYAGAPVGAYASERNIFAWRAVTLPQSITDEEAASVFVKGITARMLLRHVYPVGPGTTVLIHSAAGGLGQLMARWARHLGADGDRNRRLRRQGRDRARGRCASCHRRPRRRFRSAVADLTENRGVDAAYDGVGGTTLAKTLLCVRPFGVIASIGQSAGAIPPIDVRDLGPRRSLMLVRPSVMAFMNVAQDYRIAADAVLSALRDGILKAAGTSYRLSEAARAHVDLEGGQTSGSLYLVP